MAGGVSKVSTPKSSSLDVARPGHKAISRAQSHYLGRQTTLSLVRIQRATSHRLRRCDCGTDLRCYFQKEERRFPSLSSAKMDRILSRKSVLCRHLEGKNHCECLQGQSVPKFTTQFHLFPSSSHIMLGALMWVSTVPQLSDRTKKRCTRAALIAVRGYRAKL